MSVNAPPPQGDSFADIEGAPPPGAAAAMPQAEVVGGIYGGTVSGEPMFQPDGRMTGPLALNEGATGHTYYEGDQFSILKGLNTEDLVRLQEQLAAVGLAANPLYGEVGDESTLNAMSKLLSLANRSGTSWDATLTRLSTNPRLQEEAKEPEFEEPTYLAPDYASIAQRVKGMFRDQLGRDPDQGEMAQFTAELQGWDKDNFNAQVAADRADFEGEGGGTVQSVDPVARFQERFEQVYKPELNFVRDKGRAVETREQVEASTGLLSAMSQQGGR